MRGVLGDRAEVLGALTLVIGDTERLSRSASSRFLGELLSPRYDPVRSQREPRGGGATVLRERNHKEEEIVNRFPRPALVMLVVAVGCLFTVVWRRRG